MGLGVLESRENKHVAGSVVLLDDHGVEQIILRPTPSEFLSDPLNWPLWKKNLLTFTLSLCVGLGGLQGLLFSVATTEVVTDYKITILKAEKFSSYPFLATGCACAVASLFARTFGKRPIYLLSAILELVSCIWSAVATSYGSQLGARILLGLGIGAFESVVLSSIGDLYFVHQRGRPTAFYSAMGLGCTQLTPVLGGYVTDKYGWRMQFWILTAFWVVAVFLVFFGVPETAYQRPAQLETDLVHENSIQDETVSSSSEPTTDSKDIVITSSKTPSENHTKKRSFAEELFPFRRIESPDNPVKLVVRLSSCALYPALWMAFLANGTFVGWFLAIVTVLAQIFAVPPFNFTPTQLGFLNSFCFPGALVAFAYGHLLSDRILKWFVRRNNRVYEPEFRLPLLIPSVIVGVIGLALFGWYTGDVALSGHDISWVLTSFFYGLIIFSVVSAQAIAYTYLLDSHRDISVEMGVFAIMLRNFFSFGAASFLPLWLQSSGVAHVFYAIAGIQGGVIAVPGLLIYIFGKRIRAFMQRHSPMRALGVDALHRF